MSNSGPSASSDISPAVLESLHALFDGAAGGFDETASGGLIAAFGRVLALEPGALVAVTGLTARQRPIESIAPTIDWMAAEGGASRPFATRSP